MDINFELLRDDLINYFGCAVEYQPLAIIDIARVEKADYNELIMIARQNKIDLNQYKKSKTYRRLL